MALRNRPVLPTLRSTAYAPEPLRRRVARVLQGLVQIGALESKRAPDCERQGPQTRLTFEEPTKRLQGEAEIDGGLSHREIGAPFERNLRHVRTRMAQVGRLTLRLRRATAALHDDLAALADAVSSLEES